MGSSRRLSAVPAIEPPMPGKSEHDAGPYPDTTGAVVHAHADQTRLHRRAGGSSRLLPSHPDRRRRRGPGTARIEPPPPSAPSETPMRNPSGETRSARISERSRSGRSQSTAGSGLTGLDRQAGGTPRIEATEDVGHTFEAVRHAGAMPQPTTGIRPRSTRRSGDAGRARRDGRAGRATAPTARRGRHRPPARRDCAHRRSARPARRRATTRGRTRGNDARFRRSWDVQRAWLRRRRVHRGRCRTRSWPSRTLASLSRPASVMTTIG